MISDNVKATNLSVRRIFKTRIFLFLLISLVLLGQFLIGQSFRERSAALIAAMGSFIVIYDAFQVRRFYKYPLSSVVLIGFSIILLLGPLLFTLLEGKSIAFNLRLPNVTFINSALAGLTAVSAHFFYRSTKQLHELRTFLHGLIAQLNIFSPLSYSELIIMSFLGLVAAAAQSWFYGNVILVKFIQGFRFFSIIPVAYYFQKNIDFNQAHTSNYKKNATFFLATYLLLLGIISLGKNSRSDFFQPIAAYGIILALQWLYGKIQVRFISLISVLLTVIIAIPIFTDFATAMVMVRFQRNEASPIELIQLTIGEMNNRDEIRKYRLLRSNSGRVSRSGWSEEYLSNPILNRFANAKYVDNSLYDSSFLDEDDKEQLTNLQISRLIAYLPTPILNLFSVDNDFKTKVLSQGYGDTLHYLATGRASVLGGFRVTSFIGVGKGSIGDLYLLVLFFSLIIIYAFVDSHVMYNYRDYSSLIVPTFSIIAITQIYDWLSIAKTTSLTALIAFPFRSFFEPILLFALIRWFLKIKLKTTLD
jgi:hypothetical protein